MNDDIIPADDQELSDLGRKLKNWYRNDITRVTEWRKEAREDYNFYSGDQWNSEDLEALRSKRRPAMVFDRIGPLVNAVVGSEINNRRETQFIPRELGDAEANEILTGAGEWFRDEANAEDEESDAFQDCVISGVGWTDTRLDFESEPDGAPKVERLDPLKMVWDANSVKPNFEDAQHLFYVDEKPYSEVMEMFPDVPKELLNAGWAKTLGNDSPEPHDQDRADHYEGGQNPDAPLSRTCTVVEARWFEKVPYYRGPDLQTGEIREYDERQVELIKKKMPEFRAVRQYRKVVKRAFIGKEVLAEPDTPLVPDGLLGWEAITGYRDKIKRQFYGLVRPTKDPQRWTNKYLSQVMFLLNSQSKGGIIAERGLAENDDQFESSWAKSDEITWVTKNSLSGQNPRFQQKPVAQFPAGFFTLYQESKEAINQVTGLSPEFIGTREVDQAGVLEYQRKQSSLSLLAPLFNSLRRYRKRQGQIVLYLIQNHLSDGRLIRIVGDGKAQYVPLMSQKLFDEAKSKALQQAVMRGMPQDQAQMAVEKQFEGMKAADGDYDIIIDDAPTSPNEKTRTWEIMQPMLPLIFDQVKSGLVPPTIILDILKYSPLPATMVASLRKAAEKMAEEAAQQPPQPDPAEVKAQAEIQAKAQSHELDMQAKQADIAANKEKSEIEVSMKLLDAYLKGQQAQNDLAIDTAKTENEAARLANQAVNDQIKQQNANTNRTEAAK